MDLQKARQLLASGDYTCVLCHDGTAHTSTRRGVAPLLELIDSGANVAGFSAADKVVGKATALLYCYLGVTAVYAHIISASAAEVLTQNGIALEFGTQVPFIRNRPGTGRCPMEQATETIDDPTEALTVIRRTLKALQEEEKP